MSSSFFKSKKAVVIYCLLGTTIILFILSKIPPVAEYFFARGISSFFNFIISRITYLLPFSLYECVSYLLILTAPPVILTIIYLLIKREYVKKILYSLFLVVICFLLCYTVSYGALYSRHSAMKNFGIQTSDVNEQKICDSIDYYLQKTIEASKQLQRYESSNVKNPYSRKQLAVMINDEYDKINDGFLYNYSVNPKYVMWSDGMSCLRISGIYFPFTGEANINANTASYELPVVVAHETAHAKGISRENEANMAAYYVCMNSDDAYLKYSGNLASAVTLLSSLKQTNSAWFKKYMSKLPREIIKELDNDAIEYKKYESFIGDVSRFFNNLFLKSNGVTNGTVSYGQTTSYLVYLGEIKKW